MSAHHTLPLCALQVEYRPIEGYPGYRVGTDGSVWSQREPGRWGRTLPAWRRLKTPPAPNGYLQVHLRNAPAGTHRHTWVHQLVLEAFVGPRPSGLVCRHFPDRDPANNRLKNLCWDTPAANARDRITHGTVLRGCLQPASRLTEADVPAIRFLRRLEWTHAAIGRLFGVSETAVRDILKGRTWRHA